MVTSGWVNNNLYKGTDGFIIMYDITNVDSFHQVNSWMSEVHKNAKKNA